MATKSTKSDWAEIRKDLQEAGRKVREFTEGIQSSAPTHNVLVQEELKANATLAYQQIENAAMRVNNIVGVYDGVKPFAGQPL